MKSQFKFKINYITIINNEYMCLFKMISVYLKSSIHVILMNTTDITIYNC